MNSEPKTQNPEPRRSRLWSGLVHRLEPYVPGEQPRVDNLVKLNTNENPYGPSPQAIAAIRAAADEGLRLYPNPDGEPLRQAVADFYGVSTDQVFLGNGSDEVLAHVFNGLFRHSNPLLFPDITYSFYPVYCGLYGIDYHRVPLAEDLSIQVTDYLQDSRQPNGGIIFPNPNAPTGRLLPLAAIRQLLAGNRDSVVAIDEAYVDFGGESAAPLVADYDNLLVIGTVSKSRALAGLRIGYAMGHPQLIEALVRVKNSFNSYPMDRLAIAGGVASFADREYFEKTCQQIITHRETLAADLQALGFEVLPSAANFLFARHPQQDGAKLLAALRQRNILVRRFNQPRIEQFLRITVGTPQQHAQLVHALQELIQ